MIETVKKKERYGTEALLFSIPFCVFLILYFLPFIHANQQKPMVILFRSSGGGNDGSFVLIFMFMMIILFALGKINPHAPEEGKVSATPSRSNQLISALILIVGIFSMTVAGDVSKNFTNQYLESRGYAPCKDSHNRWCLRVTS